MATMAGLSPRDRWLHYLHQQLAEDDGVEHLNLALYADLQSQQHQISIGTIKTPAEVFHSDSIVKNDERLALAKFRCALESLGGRLRGNLCILINAPINCMPHHPPPGPRGGFGCGIDLMNDPQGWGY